MKKVIFPIKVFRLRLFKRFITGKGNASKADVIEAVQEKGFCPTDDNEADSLALMFYVMNFSKDFNTLEIS